MHAEMIREFALNLPETEECFPFGEMTLVFKVNGKMFMLLPLDEVDLSVNLKCDPDLALTWRDAYPAHILPGYHMNKKHWNTVKISAVLGWPFIREMIEHSYELVSSKASKKRKTS